MIYGRRQVLTFLAAPLALAACDGSIIGNGIGSNRSQQIDARVDATRNYLFSRYPGTQDLSRSAKSAPSPRLSALWPEHGGSANAIRISPGSGLPLSGSV